MYHEEENVPVNGEHKKRCFRMRKTGKIAKEYNVKRWKKWYAGGKSTYEIAALAGVSQTTVWRKLKEEEVQNG